MEDTPIEVVSIPCTRQISNKCETVWLWELLRAPLEPALHFTPYGGAQVHKAQCWLSFSRGGGAGGKSSTPPCTCSRNPGLIAQPLFISCVCDCVRVWGRSERGHFGTKLDFYALLTYKGRENPYWFISSEMSCWSLGCIRGVSFCSSDLCMWLEPCLLPEPIPLFHSNSVNPWILWTHSKPSWIQS